MNRKLAIFAAVIAAFAITCQGGADAKGRHIDKKIAAVAIGVGVASTVGYFAINNWHWNSHHHHGLSPLGVWGITTVGCAAVSPIVATVVLERPLTYREAHILIGSCVIPIVGGWLVNEAYNAHPEWEPGVAPAGRKHHKKKM